MSDCNSNVQPVEEAFTARELTQSEIDAVIATRKPLEATAVHELLAAVGKGCGKIESKTDSYIETSDSTQSSKMWCQEHGAECTFETTYRLRHRITVKMERVCTGSASSYPHKCIMGDWHQTGGKAEYLDMSVLVPPKHK